ncbi:ABC transporter ATP-binding protein [Actinoallomurus rhizosphaericola]|uniref:ABC transporter ATP-binding protein n=1 Tax=Actinoallomurus rhizosphaericola TaxID=2952536 RepID=UPI00209331C1|nr:ABC transporter ATP-binding protein [Actinoallomurus rhizosphaericola]MCO5994885.1 ABC transporter ATP-binding protein [Actinoallomurus rhizosphaericola]
MNAIAFTGVAKSYGAVRAVEGLDLTIEDGSTVALLGPNGAGKSTSIGMLLGLVRPTAGEISVFGETPDAAVKHGRVGAMLQDGDLIPGLTVREVVSFVRGLYPDPMPLEEILTLANLTDLAGRRADRLSGGQAQRVRFAIAIAGAPRLLVLDEPTAAMDVESRRSFWASMREYAAAGRTILFATHYLEEADENADRVIVIARGRVVADGTPQEIKAAAGAGTVRFTIGDQPTAGLDALPGVSAVDVRGPVARLHTTDPDATVQALYATGLRVTDLEVKGADLEDAFLSLTHDR